MIALVTGITGQDGSYLAALLLEKGYTVLGAHRASSSKNFWRLNWLGIADHERLRLVQFDITDAHSLRQILSDHNVDEIYNLAAQSFVGSSFSEPYATANVTGFSLVNMLETIKTVSPSTKFYQASTSEMFGKVQEVPQSETTPFYPRSPYGVAKLFAHWLTVNYRESYDMFACSGILFNHESPLRGSEFVTRKITQSVARHVNGDLSPLVLGNINSVRDWGFAGDYVLGMWQMLQQDQPDDFVLSTGKNISVREFLSQVYAHAGIGIVFEGTGLDELGINKATGDVLVTISEEFYRPAEVDLLVGDPSKAKRVLGWESNTSISELARMMLDADLAAYKQAN